MQSPFCCIKLFESELYPVCAADQQGKPIFDLTNSQAPLLDYTPTSYMGRLVNRHLAEQGGIAGHTILVSSMSELLKIWHSMDLVLPGSLSGQSRMN